MPSGETLDLDDFEVLFSDETPGERITRTGQRLVLHNAENPCSPATKLRWKTTAKLGSEVAPRPELKKFCKRCSWPASRSALEAALRRMPKRYRGDDG